MLIQPRPAKNLPVLGTAILLLLVHMFIRTHNITQFAPYVDEGYHIRRGAVVWQFEEHPGRFANGKVLLYYWLGLFDGPPTTNLAAGRLAIALFSTITAAALYRLGRMLHSPVAGLLALGMYAVLPLAFFFERMALADPFAAGFAALVAWRSLVFARRPTRKQGTIVGALLALATLAKLTMGLLPLLPVGAAALNHDWQTGLRGYIRRYFPSLVTAAIVVVLLWLPMLVPALLAQLSGDPFIIVNNFNFQRNDPFAPNSPLAYLTGVLPSLAEFTSPALLFGVVAAFAEILIGWPRQRRAAWFLLLWLLAASGLTILFARVVSVRYLMPISAPLILILALALGDLWTRPRLRLPVIGLPAAWLLLFTLPFIATAPANLSFRGSNDFDFHSGFFTADDAVREAAQLLGSVDEPGPVYATREACHLIYFYSDNLDLRCLDMDPIPTFGQRLLDELAPGQIAYLVVSGYYGPFHYGIDWLSSEEIHLTHAPQFQGPGYEFRLWRIWIDSKPTSSGG